MFALDRVKETTSLTGTGTIQLAGAVSGFRRFRDESGTNGRKVEYLVDNGTEWEVGYGSFTQGTPDTIARDVVVRSSNSNEAVNFSAGTKTVSAVKIAVFDGLFRTLLCAGALSGGTTDYTLNVYPPPPAGVLSSLPDYVSILVRVNTANTAASGKPTLALNGGSALQITKNGGQALAAGDLATGSIVWLTKYGSTWEITSIVPPALAIPNGFITSAMFASGAVNLAAAADVLKAYDIGFKAGYTGAMGGQDLAVRDYGSHTLARDITFVGGSGSLGTAGTGADVIFDVLKNGTTIYSSKPKFAAGSTTLTAGTLSTTTASIGDKLRFAVTQKGSSVAGQKLDFTLACKLR